MPCTKCRKAFVRIVVNLSQWNGDSESIRKWEQMLKKRMSYYMLIATENFITRKNVDELVLLTQGL